MQKGKSVKTAGQVAVIAAALFIVLSSMPVAAHTPSNMTLEYDWDTQTLSVDIAHPVSDPATHHIQTIIVYKNDVMVHTESYTTQSSTSGASDTFNIPAVDGDVLRVWANCSISGFIERTVTANEPGTTTPPPPGFDSTTIILVVVVVLGLIFVLFAIMRRR